MKTIYIFGAFALCCSILGACGENDPEPDPFEEAPEEVAARKAASEVQAAEFAVIQYPECDLVWSGDRLTSCGTERLRKALSVCDEREGGQNRLDPLSAGDGWISRAGIHSMQTVEERAKRITKSDTTRETLSYALGNGTNGIKIVGCFLNDEMKLTDIMSSIEN